MAYAYRQCLRDTESKMGVTESIVVSNVFPTKRSMKNYIKLAEEYDYGVTYIVVENRRGGQNVHNVPDDVLDSMRSAFQVEL
jgi:predicted aldo/keto reductase-like oxidoreductase